MRYISTRGHDAGQRFCDILLEGLAPDGGLYLPASYPQVDDATLTRWRQLPYAELAFEILSLYVDDIPAADLRDICQRTYTREVFGTDAIVPLRPLVDKAATGDGSRAAVPGGLVQWPDAGLQGHGHAIARQPVRVRTGAPRRDAEHPGCHQWRHRQRGRIRDARQARRVGVHDQPAWAHEPVPAGADVQPDGRQHPQHRHRRRVRRLPGPGQGGVQRSGVQAQVPHRHGQFDQLGAPDGAGRVLLRRLFPGHARRMPRRCASPCRRATSAMSAPVMWRA